MKLMTDIYDKESVFTILVVYLREFGIKVPKLKKTVDKWDEKSTAKVFGNCLNLIATVETDDGLRIPRFLDEAVSLIREHICTEGLFRKAGSHSRQKHLKECVEKGGSVKGCHVLDVANLVKQFFRELPEPIIPSKMNDAFIKANQLQGEYCREHAILMLCALLPAENLHTLRFFMMFLADIASECSKNKMDSSNLALIITPNLMPLMEKSEKWEKVAGKLFRQHTGVIKLLIDVAPRIGMVSDSILSKIANSVAEPSDDDFENCCRDRNRKSARKSLAGVMKGLKTMVQLRPTSSSGDINDQIEQLPTTQSSKRKNEEDHEDASLPKKSSPDLNKLTVPSFDTMMDLPSTSFNHFDSPNPAYVNEDAVSQTPTMNRQQNGRRKSKRVNILSRAYLKRRSHTFVTPKSNKKTENRKKREFFPSPMTCVRSESSTVRRLSRSKSEQSPVEDLITISRDALKVSYNNKASFSKKMKSAIDVTRLSEVAIAVGVSGIEQQKQEEVAAVDTVEICEPKMIPRRRSNTEGSYPVDSLPLRKQGNMYISPPNLEKQPSKFESRSSLRRGRPNSVRAGLVPPKSLKLGSNDYYEDADCTPVNLQSFLPEQFVEELTTASRRSVFGNQVPDTVFFDQKSPSIDSGVGKSLLDMAVGDHFLPKRKSLSLNSLMEFAATMPFDEWQGADEVFEQESVFTTPVSVAPRPTKKIAEPVNTGRPSLALLLNEKKGTVSANVQRFNAISSAAASGPLTPQNMNAKKFQSLDVPKTVPKLKMRGSIEFERERRSGKRVSHVKQEKEQVVPARRKLSSTPKSEGKKRKIASNVANISPAKPVRM